MVAMVKSRSVIADFGALGQGDLADVERIADVEAGEADLDLLGNLGRVADQLELVADRVEHAAALEARRLLLVDEVDRHRDGDLGVLGDAQEIDMQRPVGDRVELDVLGQGAGRARRRRRSSPPSS